MTIFLVGYCLGLLTAATIAVGLVLLAAHRERLAEEDIDTPDPATRYIDAAAEGDDRWTSVLLRRLFRHLREDS